MFPPIFPPPYNLLMISTTFCLDITYPSRFRVLCLVMFYRRVHRITRITVIIQLNLHTWPDPVEFFYIPIFYIRFLVYLSKFHIIAYRCVILFYFVLFVLFCIIFVQRLIYFLHFFDRQSCVARIMEKWPNSTTSYGLILSDNNFDLKKPVVTFISIPSW